MTWQRRARFVVGAFLLIFAVVLYYAIRGRPQPASPASVTRTDPNALTETRPGTITLANGELISFARLLTYADGRSTMQDVTVKMQQQGGRIVTLTGREAAQHGAAGSGVGELAVTGNVVVTTSDGLHLTTSTLTYDDAAKLVRAPDRVEFRRGRVSGSGVGATYDQTLDELHLLSQSAIAVAPDAAGAGALSVTSGTSILTRPAHQMRFDGTVHIETADRIVETDQAVAYLTEDDARVTRVELRGHSRVARSGSAAASAGAPGLMQATDMDLDYAEDGRTLHQAALMGEAGIELAGAAGAEPTRVRAARLDLLLAADGTTVTRLSGRDAVQLDLPATADRPAQSIRAASLDAQGSEAGGLKTAAFAGGVEFRERSAAGKGVAVIERVARSATLDVTLQPQLAGVASARFLGGATFSDGTWRGEGAEARYDPVQGTLSFAAAKGSRGPLPRLADDRVTVDAEALELTLGSRQLVASGRVESTFRPPPPARAGAPADASRLPSMLDQSQPLYITGGKLVYDGQASTARYTGGARLWQGDSLVRAETITLDDQKGNLSASGQVRSTLQIGESAAGAPAGTPAAGVPAAAPTPAAASSPARTTGEGQEMQYDDAERKLTYRGAAHVNGPQGDVKAGRIEMFLAEHGSDMTRAEAYEDVSARLEGGYTLTATHLTYFAAEQRYLAQGKPVRMVEVKPDGCRETVGTILTFERSTDSITVDGTEGNRSRARPVPCTERRH